MTAGSTLPTSRLATIFGGSGFVGRSVVRSLVQRGWRVRVAVRRPDLAGDLQPMGGVGQIHAVQANVRVPASIERALDGADAVVNLVGILQPSGRQTFQSLQAEAPALIARACAARGITRFVQMSALGADDSSASAYASSKAKGEDGALAGVPGAIVLRPSVVFGPQDQFFNRFAALARALPVVPLVGAQTLFQPVFVGDVAEAVAKALDGAVPGGRIYELGGPQTRTLRELVAYVLEITQRSRPIVPLPMPVGRFQAGAIELIDKLTFGLMPDDFVITRDQVELLKVDNIVSQAAQDEGRTFAAFGIMPEAYEGIVPSYLWRFRKTGQFVQPGSA